MAFGLSALERPTDGLDRVVAAASRPEVTFVDIDDPVRSTYGYAKQGAGYGVLRRQRIERLPATVSTASSAPVILATVFRNGSANSARGAARLVADALVSTRNCGVSGTVVLRLDSAFYGRDVIPAARRAGARLSITARKDRAAPGRDQRDPRRRVDHHPLPASGVR